VMLQRRERSKRANRRHRIKTDPTTICKLHRSERRVLTLTGPATGKAPMMSLGLLLLDHRVHGQTRERRQAYRRASSNLSPEIELPEAFTGDLAREALRRSNGAPQFAREEGDAFGSVGALIAPPNPPSASKQARHRVGVGGQPELGLRSDEG
jgi:hypothetical protein